MGKVSSIVSILESVLNEPSLLGLAQNRQGSPTECLWFTVMQRVRYISRASISKKSTARIKHMLRKSSMLQSENSELGLGVQKYASM